MHCSVYFICFFFGTHVRAVFLPLSPASTLVCNCFCSFWFTSGFSSVFFFHVLCWQINLIWFDLMKHQEVFERSLYKCISGGLMHVAAWYHGTPGPKFTKFAEWVSIGQTPNATKYRRAPTKSMRGIRCGKILLPGKVGQKLTLGHQICHQYRWFCIANATFAHAPRLSPKIWRRSPTVRSMSSVVQWAG